jgi:hypothetical protein
MTVTRGWMGWFEYNIFYCNLWDVGSLRWKPQRHMSRKNWELPEGCVARFWGLWKKGKSVSDVNVWYVPLRKLWVHLGGDVGLWKKIWLVDANWNYDNLKVISPKKIDPPNLQFLLCFFDSLDTLIRIRNWLDVGNVVRKQEYCIRTCIIGVVKWSKRITWIYYDSYEVVVSCS